MTNNPLDDCVFYHGEDKCPFSYDDPAYIYWEGERWYVQKSGTPYQDELMRICEEKNLDFTYCTAIPLFMTQCLFVQFTGENPENVYPMALHCFKENLFPDYLLSREKIQNK